MTIKFKFKPGAEVSSSEPHYDLFDGGYIKPEELLADPEQAKKVNDAVRTIQAFFDQAEAEGVLEFF